MKSCVRKRRNSQTKLLHHVFEAQAKLRPQHMAVWCDGRSLSYSELNRRASRIARLCLASGVKPGSFVGLYFKKSVNLFAAILGVLKAGAAYVPMDPKCPPERVRDICEDAKIEHILSEGEIGRAMRGAVGDVNWLLLDEAVDRAQMLARSRLRGRRRRPHADQPCYSIFTSGSTGRPKGVCITHRNALAFVRGMKKSYGLSRDERIYQGFSVAFDASVEEIWAAFSMGASLIAPTEDVSRSPADAADFIERHQITYFSTVPSFLAMIPRELPCVRILVLGGEACPPHLVTRWATPERRMLNTYGPTEATVVATLWECAPGQPVSIGSALPGYTVHVLDDSLNPVKPGEEGELYIGGPAVAAGYVNRPDLTAERFIPDPAATGGRGRRLYRTSDRVRLGLQGELYFLGRLDGQIKLRGFRIELSEIEAVLMDHAKVSAAAVNVFDVNGSRELGAFVVPNGDFDKNARSELAQHMRDRLPDYMVPKYLDLIDALPRMTSGKTDRCQLPEPQTLLKGADRPIAMPRTELERGIHALWKEALGIDALSIDDDFFLDLGGHSLLASQVASDLRDRLRLASASVRHIYDCRTIRKLAAALENTQTAGQHPAATTETPAERAFRSVPPAQRRLCVCLQALSLVLYYLIASSPLTYAVLMVRAVHTGMMTLEDVLYVSTFVGFAFWPSMLLLSIMLKWIVIGRYRPGRYPVWSLYYFRWWFVNRFQSLSWSHMFAGTPLMSLYYRAMGARVGWNCLIGTPWCSAFDVVSIGEGTSIGADTQLLGYRVEDGVLIIAPVEIGKTCFVGMHCALGLNVRMGDGSALDDMSSLLDGACMAPGEQRQGVPAAPAKMRLPAKTHLRRRYEPVWALLHLALIYVMGYFLIAAFLPSVLAVAYAFKVYGNGIGTLVLLAATPFTVGWYLACALFLKRLLIGKIKAGTYSVRSITYLRFWFLGYLMANTREILMPLYSTIFFPSVLRRFGARVGKTVEVATIMHAIPDLLDVQAGSFLADASLIGGSRIHGGSCEIGMVRIGERTFVGNSAFIPASTVLGNNCLVGVMSVPPLGEEAQQSDRRWLGSPAFELPNAPTAWCFGNEKTYAPTRWLVGQRIVIDCLRVCMPGWMTGAGLAAYCLALGSLASFLTISEVILLSPFLSMLVSAGLLVTAATFKFAVMGRFKPVVKPLWCRYVWFNELVIAVYESVGAAIMEPLVGTPFIAVCLRLFGVKLGRWAFIDTTLFSEYDLVEIGDYAALNLGVTMQTHLFEDRIMKSDRLIIKRGCSVGNMAVVLYSSTMEEGAILSPLSVLMKGEKLAANMQAVGIPAAPIPAPAIRGLTESLTANESAVDLLGDVGMAPAQCA